MDRITESLLKEFIQQNNLQALSEDRAFEHFAGFLAASSHYYDSLSSDDIVVGDGEDCGIDSIAIFVNGMLVTEPEEIEGFIENNGHLDVTFVFVQAERSGGFESSKIGSFIFGVQDFFAEKPQLSQNDKVKLACRIAKEIFDQSKYFKKGNPQCYLYYVTTGKWVNDSNLVARRDSAKKDVEDLNIFRKVDFACVGADWIQRTYQETQNAISTEILFSERAVIPEIPGVEQAYVGILPASQFLKIIENTNEEILNSIFYDNVRHWQDWNPVNNEMRATLENASERIFFPLLNNGVTIVAKRIRPTGNKFLLEDYQVVNGCQTSYVLHYERLVLNDQVMIPVRLIATQDERIRNAIIRATNRQTLVTEDQFFALTDFPKKLEAYFPTFEGKRKLYYERRSRQYDGVSGIERARIINMTMLVRAFASIFLELPHRTTRNYKALLKSIGIDIFSKDHRLEPYYLAAYAYYRLEYLFRRQVIAADLKPARYHLLLAYRFLASSSPLPRFNSHEMKRYCLVLLESLWDENQSKNLFERAAKVIRKVAGGNMHRDHIRTETFTENVLKELRGKSAT